LGYNIYRATSAGGPYTKINPALMGGTRFFDIAVPSGRTYYYIATAVDSAGLESAGSNQTQAVVP
jgi:fibronectin type 3 domain-containing protein